MRPTTCGCGAAPIANRISVTDGAGDHEQQWKRCFTQHRRTSDLKQRGLKRKTKNPYLAIRVAWKPKEQTSQSWSPSPLCEDLANTNKVGDLAYQSKLIYSCATAPDLNRLRHYCPRHPGWWTPWLFFIQLLLEFISCRNDCQVINERLVDALITSWAHFFLSTSTLDNNNKIDTERRFFFVRRLKYYIVVWVQIANHSNSWPLLRTIAVYR